MVGSQIFLKQAIVKMDWVLKNPRPVQWSGYIVLWGQGRGRKIVIWALKDLNDKSEASSHLYTAFDREILLDTELQIVYWIKGYENESGQLNENHHCSQDRYWLTL